MPFELSTLNRTVNSKLLTISAIITFNYFQIYEFGITGRDLGKSSILFYVTKNTQDNVTASKLPQRQDVIVANKHFGHAFYLRIFLMALYIMNLIVIGGQVGYACNIETRLIN